MKKQNQIAFTHKKKDSAPYAGSMHCIYRKSIYKFVSHIPHYEY